MAKNVRARTLVVMKHLFLLLRKAEELMRLIDVQSASISSLNISGSCKAVICLEMAAQMCGEHVDRVCICVTRV